MQYKCMALSAAFGQVAELLSHVEGEDRSVRDISLSDASADDGSISGEARVCLPVLQDLDAAEGVSISASDARLDDDCVEVSLQITVDESALGGRNGSPAFAASDRLRRRSVDTGRDIPAYKDPEALEAVYEEHDTFPEMTRALGVDVTAETVRRYMVKHDIHDPDEPDRPIESTESAESAEPAEPAKSTDDGGIDEGIGGTESDASSRNAITEPPTADEQDERSTADGESEFESRTIAEILETADRSEEEGLIADGSGIPQSLTVGELTRILDHSRTVTEAKRKLDLSYEQTRCLLHELGLVDFVSGRLASSYTDVPPELVFQRLTEVTNANE